MNTEILSLDGQYNNIMCVLQKMTSQENQLHDDMIEGKTKALTQELLLDGLCTWSASRSL